MLVEGKVGPVIGADQSFNELRQGRDSALIVQDAHGHFYEAVARGNVYGVLNTAARALTVSLTTTASLAIWNPTNSGKILAILATAFRWGSGTFAAGYCAHCLFPASALPGGTAANPINLLTGVAGSMAKAFELATGMSTGVQVRFAASHGAITTDQSTTAFSGVNREIIDGAILVYPGNAYGIISNSGAGTSPTAWFEYMYEEVPL